MTLLKKYLIRDRNNAPVFIGNRDECCNFLKVGCREFYQLLKRGRNGVKQQNFKVEEIV